MVLLILLSGFLVQILLSGGHHEARGLFLVDRDVEAGVLLVLYLEAHAGGLLAPHESGLVVRVFLDDLDELRGAGTDQHPPPDLIQMVGFRYGSLGDTLLTRRDPLPF